jgi:peroxiredoxin/mono/diheme cytochrome c family protein
MVVALCGMRAWGESIDMGWEALKDIEGRHVATANEPWKVVCFLGAECPLAQLYAPRLQRLNEDFARRGVQVIGVNSNPQDSVEEIRRYAAEHKLSFPLVKDGRQTLARRLGATRTPEVFVLDTSNRVRYRGRIDDQYEPGISRPEPKQHHLGSALAALVEGRDVEVASTEPAGCLITFVDESPPPVEASSAVTFTRDVAPILNRHCVECHRPGAIGPFSLTDYDEVIGWGEMMLEVIELRRMPPWHADPRYGKFIGARTMPEEDRATLAAWVAQGMPQGDPQDLPPLPVWAEGWHLPTSPDVEFPMCDRPFAVAAEGTIDYQYFVVDPQWDEDRWIRAAQVVPGEASVVHHAIAFVRPPDGSPSEGIGWLGGYVPGQRTTALPTGHARRIPAHSKIVFQMHYTPNGRAAQDLTRLGVWFAGPEEVTHEVTTRVALNHHFEIPPGAGRHTVHLRLDEFARDGQLLGAMPHMHLRGKSFRLDVRQSERTETLLHVPEYDFNWQHWYQLQTPLPLENVAALQMEVVFDNSAQNPTNPDPDEYVTWGDQTWQEMAVAFFDIAHPRGKPRIAPARPTGQAPVNESQRRRRIQADTKKFLAQLDQDSDGVIVREEAPEAFRRFGFGDIDHNGDGRLEYREIEAEAARRQ